MKLNRNDTRPPRHFPDIVDVARDYLTKNAAESGADVIIKELSDEVERVRRLIGGRDERCGQLEKALTNLIDAIEAKNERRIESALFVGRGLTF